MTNVAWRLKDASEKPVRFKEGITIDDDDGLYRPLAGRTDRDLMPMEQYRMQQIAAYQWETNPLVNRLVELPVAFLLGEGVTYEVDDTEAQGWLDAFWNDPINRMDLNLEKHVRELSLFGEQCWPVFVDKLTGMVRLGKVDPTRIAEVIADPANVSVAIGVKVSDDAGAVRTYRVIYDGDDDALFDKAARDLRAAMGDGECFFWRVNDLSSGRRGRSDIMAATDHADSYEQMIFGEGERAVTLRQILWDVTVKNATPEEIAARAKEIEPPGPNAIRVHNDSEEWKIETPQLGSAETAESLRSVRNHVLGSRSVPESWFGGAGDVNLATALAMDAPTYKIFSQRQKLWKAILEAVLAYAIRQRLWSISSELVGLAGTPAFRPRVTFPELSVRDVSKYATALQQVVVAAVQAVAAGVMSEETAVKLIALAAGQLGLEIDPVEELKRARADAGRKAELDVYRAPPAAEIIDTGEASNRVLDQG